MTKFPFVVGPKNRVVVERIGSEEAGYIEIERLGYLTVGEQATVQQAVASDSSSQRLLSLVRRCASSYKLDMEEAYKSVMGAMGAGQTTKTAERILKDHGDEIEEITTALTAAQGHQQMVKAFVMLSFRVSDKLEFNELVHLHPDLLAALVELYEAEEKKSLERLSFSLSENGEEAEEEASAEILEQAEKKSAADSEQG